MRAKINILDREGSVLPCRYSRVTDVLARTRRETTLRTVYTIYYTGLWDVVICYCFTTRADERRETPQATIVCV